jgi:hypothetical protein
VADIQRDLRDSWAFRFAAIAVVLLVALLVGRGCGASDRTVSQAQAERIARASTSFKPDRLQIRLVQQGIPPRAIWAVSLYDVDAAGNPTRFEVVRVDGRTGAVLEP